uniref:Uncharacterized protein n=1 Tax=Acrobeloides nanus TaxID=290746 RepID=A0A914D4K8_9BILA
MAGKRYVDSLNRCQRTGQDQVRQGSDGYEKKPVAQDCQRCRQLCAHGTGKHCGDCLKRCQGGGQGQLYGQVQKDQVPNIGQGLEHPDSKQDQSNGQRDQEDQGHQHGTKDRVRESDKRFVVIHKLF